MILPPELLTEVFVHCTEGTAVYIPPSKQILDGSLPWNLAHVSSRWRQIAMNEPRLWTTISLASLRRADFRSEAESVFERSVRRPSLLLTLKVVTLDLPHLGLSDSDDLVRWIFEKHGHRIGSLECSSEVRAGMWAFLGLSPGLFQSLRSITLRLRVSFRITWWLSQGEARVFQGIPGLRTATIQF